ncbi:MAG: hypothetical protein RL173_490 [Fibrobacterota bacterium]|jgi:O-antigen/teichoic acid export membrane protein
MNPSRKIAVNMLSSYGRSVISAGLALFSSRWVLNTLGQSDYGLYNVVGSLIAFVVFLNGVLSNSASRHFAFAIGKGSSEEVRKWFNASLGIHLLFASALVLLGWPIGEYFLKHHLTVPVDRLETCIWVFRGSLVSAFLGMVSVPFVAMFTAKQYISELALWALAQSALAFVLAYFLSYVPGDHLLTYAFGMVGIITAMQVARILRGFLLFEECRPSPQTWFSRHHVSELFGFALWNTIGSAGAILRDQGSNLLLNMHFGPGVNAAFGIANQVSGQSTVLSSAMIGAFSPEITSSEGRGDRARMLSLSQKASKYGTLLVLLFSVPLLLEMEYVLELWLKHPPQHAAGFCRWMLAAFMIDRLSIGAGLAVNARGKIAAYQCTVGLTVVAAFPLAWIFIILGSPPTGVGAAFALIAAVITIGRQMWASRLFNIPIGQWNRDVLLPTLGVALVGVLAGLIPTISLPSSFLRLGLSTVFSTLAMGIITWKAILAPSERELVLNRIPSKLRRQLRFKSD